MANELKQEPTDGQPVDPGAVTMEEALRAAFELIGEGATMDRIKSRRDKELAMAEAPVEANK